MAKTAQTIFILCSALYNSLISESSKYCIKASKLPSPCYSCIYNQFLLYLKGTGFTVVYQCCKSLWFS